MCEENTEKQSLRPQFASLPRQKLSQVAVKFFNIHSFLCKGFMQCFAKIKFKKKKADLTKFRIDLSTCPVKLNKTLAG